MTSAQVWHGVLFFFFQAEDGIRDVAVTGVQTCALPILPGAEVMQTDLDEPGSSGALDHAALEGAAEDFGEIVRTWKTTYRVSQTRQVVEIGRASCRERV